MTDPVRRPSENIGIPLHRQDGHAMVVVGSPLCAFITMTTITLYRLENADLTDRSVNEVLSTTHQREELELRPRIAARLFMSSSRGETPDWARYLSSITRKRIKLPERDAIGAVLLLKPYAKERILYVATWGIGHFLLKTGKVDVQAGLRCALNLMSAKPKNGAKRQETPRVRALRSKRVSQNTLIMAAQASARATIDTFPFSTSSDQLRQVTGRPTDPEKWGRTVTGGISMHIKRPEPDKLMDLCRDLEGIYKAKDYKAEYGWIDNLAPVSDKTLLDQGYQWALDELKKATTDQLNITPPALIEWDQANAFEYQFGNKRVTVEDASADTLTRFLRDNGLLNSLTVVDLQDKLRLNVLDSSEIRTNSWPIARCISGEMTRLGKSYVIDDGSMFEVNRDYLDQLNRYVSAVPKTALSFPGSKKGRKREREDAYNKRIAERFSGAILLDKRTIRRQQATAIEVCDVALRNKKLIHVKRGVSSSSLSHLFAQGVVSAELLCMDEEFKGAVRSELEKTDIEGSGAAKMDNFRWLYTKFEQASCEVIYIMLTEQSAAKPVTALPFFSKVNLRLRCEELRRMGYQYSIGLVPLE